MLLQQVLAMTAALGTAVLDANTLVDLTGQAMTMQEGQADSNRFCC